MAKNPSFNFYSSDFLTETMFLSFEDKGKLIMLMCLQHQHGHLKKEQMLKTCESISDDLWEFFKIDEEGKYYNEQIDVATKKRENFINKQKNNISKRWNKFGITKSIPNQYQSDTKKDNLVIPLENENEIEKEKEIEQIEKRNKVVRRKEKRFVKPTKQEITEYAIQENYRTDIIDRFIDHYEANGWKVGKAGLPMKDWKATFRNWNRNNFEQTKTDQIEEILQAGRE